MAALQSDRRRALEKVVKDARDVAEQGARAALESLAVHHHEPHSSMTPAQRNLRARLRAHGKQLGDDRDERKGGQQIDRLVAECAYEHWHRMLFARFLAENDLLIEPESGAAVTLDECAELAKGTGRDAWEVAGGFAQWMLAQVFRTDDPALQVALSPETSIELEGLLASLPRDVFLADDSLGWTYQFWQSAEKDRVNERAKAGEKITGRTLPAVTQLFTEHYMVLFLLHNTIGAWWAAKQMAAWTDEQHGACADEFAVRRAVALPEYEFEYLRFVRDEAARRWRPAAGAFESWPREARELRVLDPCCGSGHFLVAAFDLLTRLREREEELPRDRAAVAALEANVFGLELDPRCTQIAAFALAFAAWKRIGRVRELPTLRVACSGLAIHGDREEWAKLAGEDALLRGALESLHATFAQAPELGSLVDPRRADVGGFKLTFDFEKLLPLLTTALGRHGVQRDAEQFELGVAAQGLALAAELLAGSYTLVATNVPYLGRKLHSDALKDWADSQEPVAKNDLATLFVSRMLRWVGRGGTIAVVTPQNWLFLTSYRRLRERLLEQRTWNIVARLGPKGFQTPMWDFNVMLAVLSGMEPPHDQFVAGIDVASARRPDDKAALLRGAVPLSVASSHEASPTAESGQPTALSRDQHATESSHSGMSDVNDTDIADSTPGGPADGNVLLVRQADQLANPDARIALIEHSHLDRLEVVVGGYHGQGSRDSARFMLCWWEFRALDKRYVLLQTTVSATSAFGGAHYCLLWENGEGQLAANIRAYAQEGSLSPDWNAGLQCWGRPGVVISQTGRLPAALYLGQAFDSNSAVLQVLDVAHEKALLPALWCFASSPEFVDAVRVIDQALKVTNASLVKVPFDHVRWLSEARQKYPQGLPQPQSNDPTEWLFHGHPAGMLAGGSASASPFGVADSIGAERHGSLISREPNSAAVLQVAIARIAGYSWPAELDVDMHLDVAARAWVERCGDLAHFVDDDGVVPLVPMRNEPAADARVRELLRVALGDVPSSSRESTLLAEAARTNGGKSPAANIDDWLRNRFFEEHCALFHQRPFVWHIWDGRKKDGFGVLVHYHRLVAPNGAGRRLLEKLTHGYLGDWIKRQRDEVSSGKEGADARLAAALALQEKLTKILEGEPPYDLFVRWKPLHQQAIGWEPDINDGVRINIRPFVEADILRVTPKIKWTKDRGSEPQRPKADFPWFWGWDERTEDFAGGSKFTGERFNDLHYTTSFKRAARARKEGRA
jgi:hypothetical protein